MLGSHDDFSYREMNKILKDKGDPFIPNPPKGILTNDQILKILDHLGVKYNVQNYDKDTKPPIPYQRYVYGSVESGFPALLCFFFGGASGHMVPILGHTFNEDTWTPRAHTMYMIGKKTRYVPSEAWVSTYICHDDNAGSHFCIPRQYLEENRGLYVIAIRPQGTVYSAPKAESIAADYLYSFVEEVLNKNTFGDWNERLKKAINTYQGWVVLRPIYITGIQYIEHLRNMRGWKSERIRSVLTDTLDGKLNGQYWMVEISLPELFPANKRKLGEILLDATQPLSDKLDLSTFVLARFPEYLFMLNKDDQNNIFLKDYETDLKTHSAVFGVSDKQNKFFSCWDIIKKFLRIK